MPKRCDCGRFVSGPGEVCARCKDERRFRNVGTPARLAAPYYKQQYPWEQEFVPKADKVGLVKNTFGVMRDDWE